MDKNKKDNEIARLSGLSARDTGKIFDDTYTDEIKRAKTITNVDKNAKEAVDIVCSKTIIVSHLKAWL
ncbi:hypothetical protein [Mycoplasmopsis bovis]|uniref:hypothetical protein n=1 Tax=Mycoplasmopsis bovis TaxID=28903 RepID=UPI003D2692FA